MKSAVSQGSMVAPSARAKAQELSDAHHAFLTALVPADGAHPRAPLAMAPLVRSTTLFASAGTVGVRQASLALNACLGWPCLISDPNTWSESMAIGNAIVKQWQGLQAQWVTGWSELAKEMCELRHINTMTKYADQEANLMQQSLGLVTAQVTSTVRAQEDILVGLSWWMSRRAEDHHRQHHAAG